MFVLASSWRSDITLAPFYFDLGILDLALNFPGYHGWRFTDVLRNFLKVIVSLFWVVVSNEVGNDVHFFPFPVDNYSVHFHHKPRKYKRVKTYQELLGCRRARVKTNLPLIWGRRILGWNFCFKNTNNNTYSIMISYYSTHPV